MTERKENILLKATMTYGLYMGVAFSLVVLFVNFTGFTHKPGDFSSLVNSIIMVLAMLYFGKQYKEHYSNNNLPYKQAFRFTVLLSVFSAIIFAFFSYLYYAIIEPDALFEYIKQTEEVFKQFPGFAMGNENVLNMITPGFMAFTVGFNQILFGVFAGLVVAIFIRTPVILSNNNLEK